MPNFYLAPEISVYEVNRKIKAGEKFILLDVRELDELNKGRFIHPDVRFSPLSRINLERLKALSERTVRKNEEIIVICHHGIRSALVTAWLRNEGWKNVFSMDGGLAAYARHIDPSIGSY
jgi:rhodanese-related sulfurtransferase